MNRYRKLTRKRRSFGGFTQAWMADDHLLIVDSTRLAERYQRFAFADIQAIVIGEGPNRAFIQILALTVSLSWGLYALEAETPFTRWFFALTGGIAAAFAILDVARGRRCRCVLQTAVSREILRPVSRFGVARKFLAAITPAIAAAQGSLASEQIHEAVALPELPSPSPPSVFDAPLSILAAPAGPADDSKPPAIVRPAGYFAEVLFGLLVLDSALVAFSLRTAFTLAFGALVTIYMAELVLGIAAFVQSRSRSDLCLGLAIVAPVATLVDALTFSGPAVFKEFFGVFISAAQRGGPPPSPLFDEFVFHTPIQTILISAGWRMGLGLLGLAACFADRRKGRA